MESFRRTETGPIKRPLEKRESIAEGIADIGKDIRLLADAVEQDPSRVQEMLADLRMYAAYLDAHKNDVLQLENHATFDTLTQLPNRRHFTETLAMQAGHALRSAEKGVPPELHVLYIDIDKFKEINDGLGHDTGDLYLKTVATAMREALPRDTDVVARKGGDEFVALLLDCDAAAAERIAERLREAVRRASGRAKHEYQKVQNTILPTDEGNVTASIGFASLAGENDSAEALEKRADQAMYMAKSRGRDQVVQFSQDMADGDSDGVDGKERAAR